MRDFLTSLPADGEWIEYWSIEQNTANALVKRGFIETRDGLMGREARLTLTPPTKPLQ